MLVDDAIQRRATGSSSSIALRSGLCAGMGWLHPALPSQPPCRSSGRVFCAACTRCASPRSPSRSAASGCRTHRWLVVPEVLSGRASQVPGKPLHTCPALRPRRDLRTRSLGAVAVGTELLAGLVHLTHRQARAFEPGAVPVAKCRVLQSVGVLLQVCVFRAKSITDSGASRSPIPEHGDHRFRSKPIAPEVGRRSERRWIAETATCEDRS